MVGNEPLKSGVSNISNISNLPFLLLQRGKRIKLAYIQTDKKEMLKLGTSLCFTNEFFARFRFYLQTT